MRKKTTESFINECRKIEYNYSYDKVNYINSSTKVIITCIDHGDFNISPNHFLNGQKCPSCSSLSIGRELFINRSSKVHNNKYDYSLVDYINNKKKVIIICPLHGEFDQIPKDHLNGSGCKNCRIMNADVFASRVKEINSKFTCIEFNGFRKKATILCEIHGEFKSLPNNILRGQNCPKCSIKNKIKWTNDDFIIKSKELHGDRFSYDSTCFNNVKDKLVITCTKHGDFMVTPNQHISSLSGCPKCNTSKGENKILKYLNKNNIKYNYQHKFDNCKGKSGYKLIFDFYIEEYNTIIEYDGVQHFKPIDIFGKESYFKTRENDIVKDLFCIENKIKIIRIPYTNYEYIDDILNNTLKYEK